MLKKILFIALIVVSIVNVGFAAKLKATDTVALIDFDVEPYFLESCEEAPRLAELATDYVRENIAADGRIRLLNKELVDTRLASANIIVPLKIYEAREIGQMLGCKYLMLGKIYVSSYEWGCWYHPGATKCPANIIGVKTNVMLRVVDAKNNKIIMATIGEGRLGNRYGDATMKIGNYDVSRKVVNKSIEMALDKATGNLIRKLFDKTKR